MMDANENILLKSTVSNFIAITQTIDGMTVFPTIKAFSTNGNPNSQIYPSMAKYTNTNQVRSENQTLHEALSHVSVQCLKQMGIK